MSYKVLQEWDVPQEVKDLPAPAGYQDHYSYGDVIGMPADVAQKYVEAGILEHVEANGGVIAGQDLPRNETQPLPYELEVEFTEEGSYPGEDRDEARQFIQDFMAKVNDGSFNLPSAIKTLKIKRT